MTALAALLLSLSGFAALALAMARHHRALFGVPPRRMRARVLRVAGVALLALSLTACVAARGGPVGTVLWFGVLTVAALAVALLLATIAARNIQQYLQSTRIRPDPVSQSENGQ